MICILPTGLILEVWDNLTWAIKVNQHRGSARPSRVDIVGDVRYVNAGLKMLWVMLIGYRFVALASKPQMTVVVPTVNASNKNAFSPQSPPKRKPSCQPTLPTRIFAILGLYHPNVVDGRCILNKVHLLFMGLTDNHWGR